MRFERVWYGVLHCVSHGECMVGYSAKIMRWMAVGTAVYHVCSGGRGFVMSLQRADGWLKARGMASGLVPMGDRVLVERIKPKDMIGGVFVPTQV